jgi:hypothetical protein
MPKYDIFASCNACGDVHSTGISLTVDYGPTAKQNIADAFARKDLPANLAALKSTRVYCPKTGRTYAQSDYKRIFLVPIG